MKLDIELFGPQDVAVPAMRNLRRLVATVPGLQLPGTTGTASPDDLIVAEATVLTAVLAAPAVTELIKALRTWLQGINETRKKTIKVQIGSDITLEASNIDEQTLARLEQQLLVRANSAKKKTK